MLHLLNLITFGTFLNKYDVTRTQMKTANLWVVLSHGMKTTILKEKLPMKTPTSGLFVAWLLFVVLVLVYFYVSMLKLVSCICLAISLFVCKFVFCFWWFCLFISLWIRLLSVCLCVNLFLSLYLLVFLLVFITFKHYRRRKR